MSTAPSSSCYKTSNNKYANCPPRMDDARHFTDYRPNGHVNNLVRANNNIKNQIEYRQFLMHHANQLMQLNRAYACQKNCCGPCSKSSTAVPLQSMTRCTKDGCNTTIVDGAGLGVGREYGVSTEGQCEAIPDHGAVHMSNNRCTTDEADYNYYDSVTSEDAARFPRDTVPSGGKALRGGPA